MLFDTNVVMEFVWSDRELPGRMLLSVVVAGELEVFAVRNKWGGKKLDYLRRMRERYPCLEITSDLISVYAFLEAYSQNCLLERPLPVGLTARNMGDNDLWLATTALYFDTELYTTDPDLDHLDTIRLRINRL